MPIVACKTCSGDGVVGFFRKKTCPDCEGIGKKLVLPSAEKMVPPQNTGVRSEISFDFTEQGKTKNARK